MKRLLATVLFASLIGGSSLAAAAGPNPYPGFPKRPQISSKEARVRIMSELKASSQVTDKAGPWTLKFSGKQRAVSRDFMMTNLRVKNGVTTGGRVMGLVDFATKKVYLERWDPKLGM